MRAIIICIIIGVIVGLFSNSIPLSIIIGIISIIVITIIEITIKNNKTGISNKIISLIPLMGTNVYMNEDENEYFTEDDGYYTCIVKNGILEEINATITGETFSICNNKLDLIKKYLKTNNFEYGGKTEFGIISESFGNYKYEVRIQTPRQDPGIGFTSLLTIR